MEVDQDDENDQAEGDEAEHVLLASPRLVLECLEEHVTDEAEEHHQSLDEKSREAHLGVQLVAGRVEADPVGEDEPRQVHEKDFVEQQDVGGGFVVLKVAAALAHASVDVVLPHEGLVQLVELLLLANENDLFEDLNTLFGLGLLLILTLFLLGFLLLFGFLGALLFFPGLVLLAPGALGRRFLSL